MADVLVRNVDSKMLARLKRRAKRSGRSLQAEARMALERAAGEEQVAEILSKWRGRMKGRAVGSSVKLIREDRRR